MKNRLLLTLDLQIASRSKKIPSKYLFSKWLTAAYRTATSKSDKIEITLRIVDTKEITFLNNNYRHKNKPTNILSFPSTIPIITIPKFLGDIIICAPIVNQESLQLKIPSQQHWAHLTIHGLLHLLGYDHHTEKEALIMESLEDKVMGSCLEL